MKKLFLLVFLFFSMSVSAQWSNWFNTSDQLYKIYVVGADNFIVTQGYFLTSFPCYGKYAQEYYRTIEGRNMITVYCLEPPKEIYLTYLNLPIGGFAPRNAKAQGYMKCPVKVQGSFAGAVIPRMQVDVKDCAKSEINPNANKDILKEYNGVEL